MKFYYLIGRLVSPFALLGFWVHQKLFHTPRARVVVINEKNELLLVRSWTGENDWSLPGGGVEKAERPVEAAKRELFEETGIAVPLDAFTYLTTLHYKYQAPIYTVTVQSHQLPPSAHNPWEITAIAWFPVNDFPTRISPLVRLGLKALSKTI